MLLVSLESVVVFGSCRLSVDGVPFFAMPMRRERGAGSSLTRSGMTSRADLWRKWFGSKGYARMKKSCCRPSYGCDLGEEKQVGKSCPGKMVGDVSARPCVYKGPIY